MRKPDAIYPIASTLDKWVYVCPKCKTWYTSNVKIRGNPCKCDWRADIPDRPTPLPTDDMLFIED